MATTTTIAGPAPAGAAAGARSMAAGSMLPVLGITPIQRFGFLVLLFELYIHFTRQFDVVASGLRIPMVAFFLTIAMMLINSDFMLVLREKLMGSVLLWFGWTLATTPFSTWRSNSVSELQTVTYGLVVCCAIATMAGHPDLAPKALRAMGWFTLVLVGLAALFKDPMDPRLTLRSGMYADPNALAMSLVMGLPFLWMVARTKGIGAKLLFWTMQAPLLMYLMKTGSRGGTVALAAVYALLWLRSKPLWKALYIAGGLAAGLGLWQTMPAYTKIRYLALFDKNIERSELVKQLTEDQLAQLGISSSESRTKLLEDGLAILMRHPILGTGLDNFGNERWKMYLEEAGIHNAPAQTAHNTYLQVATETGLPGLILYCVMVVMVFLELKRIKRLSEGWSVPRELMEGRECLLYCYVGTLGATFFLSKGYFALMIIIGFTLALSRSVEMLRGEAMLRKAMEAAQAAEGEGAPAEPVKVGVAPAVAMGNWKPWVRPEGLLLGRRSRRRR